MASSLGELFISLGFDVDDAKLKSFKDGLVNTQEQMIKLGKSASEAIGGISAAFAGVALFVQGSADNAVKLNNMALMFGANAQAAQTFANALHQVNSQVSVAGGLDIFGKFSQMVRGQIPFGEGGAAAVARLGGYGKEGFADQSAEQVLLRIAQHRDEVRNSLAPGQSEDAKNAAYQLFLEKAGLSGARAVIDLLADHPEKYAAAGQYNMTGDQQKGLSEYAKSTAEFSEAITKFENVVAAHLAPAMTQFFNAVTAIINKVSGNEDAIGDFLLEEKEKRGVFAILPGVALYDYLTASSSTSKTAITNNTRGGRNNNPGNIKYGAFAQSHGATGQDDGGFAIFPNSGTGTSAISSLLQLYGSKNIDTIHGIVNRYTSGDSPVIQSNYERMLETMTDRGANDHLNISDPQVLKQLVAGIVRQENGAKNVTINVQSNATDNREVAKLVADHFQNQILNPANAQTNLGY